MGAAKKIAPPKIEPKKIDGEWKFPLTMELPDKYVLCPRCGGKPTPTDKKSPLGKTIFRCNNCHIEFSEKHKSRIAWCNKHRKKIHGKECRGCFEYRKHAAEWQEQNKHCPFWTLIQEKTSDGAGTAS